MKVLDPHLCGLPLVLELLQLLGCDKADGFAAGNQLGPRRHRGENDVPSQSTDVCSEVALDYWSRHHALSFERLVQH